MSIVRRTVFRYIFIIFLIYGVGYVFAQGPSNHLGKICITCHQKYSDKAAITKFSPCSKKACHDSNPTGRWGGRGSRYIVHLQKEICGNCHSAEDGRFDIHSIHTKFKSNRTRVECKICHSSPEGYNSSIAYVPPYANLFIAGSALVNTSIRIPLWNDDCGYCHPSATGAGRLHNVHERVIEGACKECHGSMIESRLDLIAKITDTPLLEETDAKKERLVVKEFFLLFDEIARQILNFYNSLRT